MKILPEIEAIHKEMTEWRHKIHMHPETAFEEYKTSDFVAEKLESFGLEVHRGLAKTGVVGTLKRVIPSATTVEECAAVRRLVLGPRHHVSGLHIPSAYYERALEFYR